MERLDNLHDDEPQKLDNDHGRNSPLRKLSRPVVKVAEVIHKKAPDVLPDHITYLGLAAMVMGMAAVVYGIGFDDVPGHVEFAEKMKMAGIFAIIVGKLCDALDGALARVIDGIDPGSMDADRGQIVDVVADRLGEHILALGRLAIAYIAGNELAWWAAVAAGMTNYLPSFMRARAEARNIVVKESGNNALELCGTTAGRLPLNVLALIAGMAGHVLVQGVIDTVSATGNTMSALRRWNEARNTPHELADELTPLKTKAERRQRALLFTTTSGAVVQIVANLVLRIK